MSRPINAEHPNAVRLLATTSLNGIGGNGVPGNERMHAYTGCCTFTADGVDIVATLVGFIPRPIRTCSSTEVIEAPVSIRAKPTCGGGIGVCDA